MAKKASEASKSEKQEKASENPDKGKQEQASEVSGKEVQEPDPKLVEQIKAGLLKDESFMETVIQSESIQERIQSERDAQVHQQTLPMKQQLEEMERKLAETTKANDPTMAEYRRLKEAGEYEKALELLEKNQAMSAAETAAEERGRQKASREILQALAARPEFRELSQEEWRQVYADAATEANDKGRSYITVEEYVSHATRRVVEKAKATVTTQSEEERKKEVSAEVEAQLKARGIKSREDDGGPEDEGDETPGGDGDYTPDQIRKMTREQVAKIPREKRHKAMASGSK
jgi:hypothetical protein